MQSFFELSITPQQTAFLVLTGAMIGFIISGIVAYLTHRIRLQAWNSEQAQIRQYYESQQEHEMEKRELAHNNELLIQEQELKSQVSAIQSELNTTKEILREKNQELAELKGLKDTYIQMKTQIADHKARLSEQAALLNETKGQLFKEFELTAAKLFEEKQKQFLQTGKQSIDAIVSPFKEQIKDLNKRIEDTYQVENNQRNQLIGQITELQKQTIQISEEANNLASALKGNNKLQGSWGELVLERLLEQTGLTKGREYHTQSTYTGDQGERLRPDVIVHLPDDKDLIIDAKVSLVEYEKLSNEQDTQLQKQFLNAHLESIKSHVRVLASKQYESIDAIKTLEFVFLFVPIEGAYLAALQASPNLFKEAQDKNVVIVSPSSLMVALRIVETIWRYEKQNTNAEKIANSAGKLYDQFVLFIESMETIDFHLKKTQDAYDKSLSRLSEGRGNLVRRIADLKSLGAKTSRKIPLKLEINAAEQEILDFQDEHQE